VWSFLSVPYCCTAASAAEKADIFGFRLVALGQRCVSPKKLASFFLLFFVKAKPSKTVERLTESFSEFEL
jgi:hypothetical protein